MPLEFMKTEYDIDFNEIKFLDCSHYGIYVGTILSYLTGKKRISPVYIYTRVTIDHGPGLICFPP